MKVEKICIENPEAWKHFGDTCKNCHNKADVVLFTGFLNNRVEIPLCLSCAWDLAELFDATTSTNFIKKSK